ncbi:MAG TPA: glutamate--cysteine ligase [Ktedonobacteraceae bacterium]
MSRNADVFTVGVEEEFQIIDPQTYALDAGVESILPLARETLGNAVQYELILSQVEVATPICYTLAEVQTALTHQRHVLIDAAEKVGKKIAAAGTHPFSPWYEQPITPKERYQHLVEDFQRLIQEQVIFGCHVHIGLSDNEIALEVMNRARLWLAPLLALSANSPFLDGADTRYASFRTGLWWTSPLAGPPPFFSSRSDHDTFIQALVTSKSVEDSTRIYWDIRLPTRYKTIEFRVMDVCMTVDETLMITGLIRALVRTCCAEARRNIPVPNVRTELLRVANWRAARYGLEEELVDVLAECTMPAYDLIERFLAFLRPALEADGDWEHISRLVACTLDSGNGAMRQRALFQRTGSMKDVVQYVIDETARGGEPGSA